VGRRENRVANIATEVDFVAKDDGYGFTQVPPGLEIQITFPA
jgi:hypothetical protein